MGTLEHYGTLAANQTVDDYLRQNQLRRLIPIKYTWPKDHPEYVPPDNRRPINDAPANPKPKRRRKQAGRY
jgi:hypothetical protein